MPRAHDIFELALSLQGPARDSLLNERCANDAALRAEVDALLAAHAKAGDFLARPTADPPTTPPVSLEREGSIIGRYKLLQSIGEGGFGWVFLAMQSEPVRRKVALKIIKPGMDTKQVIARFEAERQALAIMDHPHIARVLDGGVTDSGRPYFVMEYVVGDPIIAFADAHQLSIKDRLLLFGQVCQAVQHAHHKGIIHRDLKPGNVLVFMSDGKPFAKVIDFGIAKATGAAGGTLTDKTLFTEHRQLLGTPEYMSPEQAEGSPDIDTRTDVYALGVLLYELLTGQTPFDGKRLRSAAFAEMQRIIKEEEPPTPSLRLERSLKLVAGPSEPEASARDSSEHAAPASALPSPPPRVPASPRPPAPIRSQDLEGELDWIVMKALDKDRARRYESASQLAADVQRHLSGEAVVAAPPTLGYRMRKFVRRHRGRVVAAAMVAGALVLGTAGTSIGLVQAVRAKRDQVHLFERACQAERYFIEYGAVRHITQLPPWLEPLLREGLEIRRKFLPSDHPEISFSALTLGRVLLNQSRAADAEPFLREGLRIRRQQSARIDWEMTESIADLSWCLESQGKLDEATSLRREIYVAGVDSLDSDEPDLNLPLHTLQLARLHIIQRQFTNAETLLLRWYPTAGSAQGDFVSSFASLYEAWASSDATKKPIARSWRRNADLLDAAGRVPQIRSFVDRIISSSEEASPPLGTKEWRLFRLAFRLVVGRWYDTCPSDDELADLLLLLDPVRSTKDESPAESVLAETARLILQDQPEKARVLIESALKEQAGPSSARTQSTFLLLRALASLLEDAGVDGARLHYQSALKIQQSRQPGDSAEIADALYDLGCCELDWDFGSPDGADTILSEALEMRRRLNADELTIAHTLINLGRARRNDNVRHAGGHDWAWAREPYEEALLILRRVYPAGHRLVAKCLQELAACYHGVRFDSAALDQDKAVQLLEEAVEMQRHLHESNGEVLAMSLMQLGIAYRDQGCHRRALAALNDSLSMWPRVFEDEDHLDGVLFQWLWGYSRAVCEFSESVAADDMTGAERLLRNLVRVADASALEWGRDQIRNECRSQLCFLLEGSGRMGEAEQLLPHERRIFSHERWLYQNRFDLLMLERRAGDLTLPALLEAEGPSDIASKAEVRLRQWHEFRLATYPADHPEAWRVHDSQSLLGLSIAWQRRFAEAEPLLTEAAERVQPPSFAKELRSEAYKRVVQLYRNWEQAEPGHGYQEKADEWSKRWAAAAVTPRR